MKYLKFYLLAILVIIIDHVVKLVVHFNMDMGAIGEIAIFGDWFKLHYTENPGMAFGLELGSEYGKLALTFFRLIAMGAIGYYLYYLIKKKVPQGLCWSIALILGGAVGNLVDSIFYGKFLDNAPYDAPSPWFHGQVIDMFYIDIWEGVVANWVPIFGGDHLSLWPIFNIADASIFVGVSIILIFQKAFFADKHKKDSEVVSDENEAVNPVEGI